MPISITKDGIKTVPSLKSFIGKEADNAVKKIEERLSYVKNADCIGVNGYRNITMRKLGKHIEIVCKTEDMKDVAAKRIWPSQTDWYVMDIFVYDERPPKGKGFY